MTDRVKGFIVVLTRDIRIDDAEPLMNAIRMMKGVLTVRPSIETADDYMTRTRVKYELQQQLLDVLK